MILLQRTIICLLLLSGHVMAGCIWRNEIYESDNNICPMAPYVLDCTSTVQYKYDFSLCVANNGESVYKYNIAVNLNNPEEKPFLENVTSYTELNIHDGYLVTVPKEVYNMTKLTELKISRNKLRKINLNDFVSLQNLKKINLANNKIIFIETVETLSSHSTVQEIDLSFNFIEAVPNNFLKGFSELEHLNMSHNTISSIDKHSFEGTFQLKTLDLSHNRLQDVGNIFTQLPRLIDSNYATSKNLQKLSKLLLDDNLITRMNFSEFFDTGISELSIGRNQISCYDLAKVKYSKFSEKFNRIVSANILDYNSENINGIYCQNVINAITNVINVSDNPNSNSSILISLLKNAVENNSKSVDTLAEIVNKNEKKVEQLIETTNSILTNINNQLKILEKLTK